MRKELHTQVDVDEYLDEVASNMIEEATSITGANILSATGFARENISIVHQQLRTANLAWALHRCDRVGPGKVVGIVGGSFSGLMLAVILALVDDAIVYVLEKENLVLSRFRDKAHRHLSPVLNSRDLGRGFDPQFSTAEFRSPIFAWEAGRASDVANFWANEFARWIDELPIFPITGTVVEPHMVQHRGDGVDIFFDDPNRNPISLDLLIDATGFGGESNKLELVDYSYWESGHRLIYDHLPSPAKVLVSGCGDSGIIEALHYAIAEFDHSNITALWDQYTGLEAKIDVGMESARLDGVLRSREAERFDGEVISEIVWWRDQREYMMRTPPPQRPFAGEPYTAPILARLNELLDPYWVADSRRGPLDSADRDALDEFVLALPLEVQLTVRKGLRDLVEHWVSVKMKELAQSLRPKGAENRIEQFARHGVTIVLNGTTPTAYSRHLSPYNVWIMTLLIDLPSVSYRQGLIEEVNRRSDNRFDVTFETGEIEIYDRVISRYGPEPRPSSIAIGRPRNTQEGDWLLWSEMVPAIDPLNPNGPRKMIYPPRAAIVDAEKRLVSQTRSHDVIYRHQYIGRISLGLTDVHRGDPIYEDAQTWLAGQLAASIYPRYDGDKVIDRHNRLT